MTHVGHLAAVVRSVQDAPTLRPSQFNFGGSLNIASPSLEEFLTHAEKFGAEGVASTAKNYLPPNEHAYLVCRLSQLAMRRDSSGRMIDASVGRKPTAEERKLAEEYAGRGFAVADAA
jgi:hypothetical protein